jgi:hypothetical protein
LEHLRRYEASGEIMATYSRENFEQIASTIHADVADVCRYEKQFEAAALWYRLDLDPPKRQTPSAARQRMGQIVNTARKLLKLLGVEDPSQALDGPGVAVLQVLASTCDGTDEEAVVQATARIGRLVEILDAVHGVRELERCASVRAEQVVQIGELVVAKGHHGDVPANDWIAAMVSIYKKITGKSGISVVSGDKDHRGKATGPLIRFLQAAGKPIGIKLSPDSFAGRIKDLRTGGRQEEK